MSSLNKAMIIGRVGEDPQVRNTQANTTVANFSVATSERYKDKNGEQQETTEWHRVVAWARLAEICQEYLKKGSLVYIEGPITTKQWEDKDGQKRYTTEIKALTMQMLDTKGDSGGQGSRGSGSGRPQSQNQDSQPAVDLSDMDDDLPF